MWGFIAGALAASVFSAWSSKGKIPVDNRFKQVDGCPVSILIWETQRTKVHSQLADKAGGRSGVSHVTIDMGEIDDKGVRLMVDCIAGKGIYRVPLSKYGERRHATLVLKGPDGRETVGFLRAQLGLGYDSLGMLGGLLDPRTTTCSTLVYHCLPFYLRDRIKSARPKGAIGVAVSPAQLMLAFGAKVGGPPIVI